MVAERLQKYDVQKILVNHKTISHPVLKPIQMNDFQGLNPEQAAVLAVLINPQLRAERDKRGVASAQVILAGILPNPVFSTSYDFPFSSPTPGNIPQYSYGLIWNFAAAMAIRNQVAEAHLNLISVELNIAWMEWQVAEKAKQQVYHLALLDRVIADVKNAEEELHLRWKTLEKGVELGNQTIIQLSAAKSTLDTIRLSLFDLEQKREMERLMLNETLGIPPDQYLPISKKIEIPNLQSLPQLTDLFNGISERRFDLLAFKQGYKSQEAKLRVAIANQIPAINLGGTVSRDNSDVKMSGFSLSMELPFFNRNQGTIRIESATRKQLFDEYIFRLFKARSEIAQILTSMNALRQELALTAGSMKDLSELNQIYYAALVDGNADALTYYDSISKSIEKKINLLNIEQLYLDQYIALEISSGMFLQ